MSKLIKSFILASILLLGLSILPLDQASADTNINTTVSTGEKKKVASENIVGDFSITGIQSSIYAGGYSKAEYYTYDSKGNLVSKRVYYGYGEVKVNINLDVNVILEKFTVYIKNVGSAILKFIGKLDD